MRRKMKKKVTCSHFLKRKKRKHQILRIYAARFQFLAWIHVFPFFRFNGCFLYYYRTLKRTIPINSSWSSNGIAPTMSGVPADSRYGGRGGRGAGAYGKPPPTSGGYICNRCQKTGHIAKFCPTIGDSTYDPEIRLMNVPRTGRKRVTTLEGIDTSMSTVIQHSDGSYEVFESSASGLEKLTKEGLVEENCI